MHNNFERPVARVRRAWVAAALLALAPLPGLAAPDFPKQPVEITVLFGGPVNTVAKLLADGMAQDLGVSVVAVARTGGGGAVGYSFVQSSPPNGYNLVFNSNSVSVAFHGGNMPFDYRAFEPVAQIGMEVPALAVRADSGWKNLKEFAEAAKKQKMKVGISGRGSFTHFASAELFDKLGIEVIYVPYGTGSAPVELLGGRIDAALQWPAQFKAQADAGQVRMLAVTGPSRVPLVPDVPTAKEQGYDVDAVMWRGLAVPKGTPKDVIDRLGKAVQKVVLSADFKQRTAALGMEVAYLPAAEFGKVVEKDDAIIAKQMRDYGLTKK
jgi:tripartite-type tricarboxylate transporter receptor subunit TctC